jgi:hypothetical protein
VTLDLTRPEHREALRSACGAVLLPGMPRDAAAQFAARANPASPVQAAFAALSFPAESAAIVRALLEGLEIEPCAFPYPGFEDMKCCREKDHAPPHADCIGGDGFACANAEHHASDWRGKPKPIEPALILALLACTDRDGALAVLREAGR